MKIFAKNLYGKNYYGFIRVLRVFQRPIPLQLGYYRTLTSAEYAETNQKNLI